MIQEAEATLQLFRESFERAEREIGKVIVGQSAIVRGMLTALFANGHVLLEGVPGLGKTRLIQTLARVLDLESSRIQFTPDLMPGDIIGTQILQEDDHGDRHLVFRRGPVFAHLVLADEINRATPKTQSALLEAMQEHRVSVGRTSHTLEDPFLVMATQNPLEMEGTYPLPEAQLDRFLLKLRMDFPRSEELHEILDRTTRNESPSADTVLHRDEILDLRNVVRSVPIAREVQDYAIRLVRATHPQLEGAPETVRRFVRVGASPRGAQALVLGGKVEALLAGRGHVAVGDIRRLAPATLRHRILLNFEAAAEDLDADVLIDSLLEQLTP